ncbi:hypothetical protein [Methanobrevibacter millerae]|uniref:DUF4065 domain-containing protein n=1 Tax=Methanobrevibacter millerae TaxID=230361 RepID=A0A0U2V161_9EURY|nr:hypothetical protein [Methanobrevibacter millerae]ALT68258.1 hypothetical protein sm9_0456 [Methanobrevibacter millerae]
MSFKLSAKDFVLLLLNSDNQKPIKGNLFIQKEMFLIVEEVWPELKEELQFKAYDYGPYSHVLVNILKELCKDFLVNFEDSEGNIYSITKQGQMYLEDIEFPEGIEKKVNNLKVGSNKLGYKGLLRYVYFSYPEFTINSKIKDEVLGE